MTRRDAYITATGSFFPNEPVNNDDMERVLGQVDDTPSPLRSKILDANGITSRHYAIDDEQQTTHLNEELAASAVDVAIKRAGIRPADVTLLVTATTQGDVLVPGFASMVHGRLGWGPLEIISIGGVCNASMTAIVQAVRAVQLGDHDIAVVVGSEVISRQLKAGRFDWTKGASTRERFDAEFLRWMLSDGAGAVVIEAAPRPGRTSLRVDWTHLTSHAGTTPPVMYLGMNAADGAKAGATWFDQAGPAAASAAGMLALRQDVRQLPGLVAATAQEWARLGANDELKTDEVDVFLCHYSSERFRPQLAKVFADVGHPIAEDRWFTNLHTDGNTGAASIFTMLDRAMTQERITDGQHVMCFVPESGRAALGLARLIAISTNSPESTTMTTASTTSTTADPFTAVRDHATPAGQQLMADLAGVWDGFERQLNAVPMVQRLESGSATLTDYHALLVNLRQQVMEGGRWIGRAASSMEIEYFELRSTFLEHASEEHRDFRLLEDNFAASGGDRAVIQHARKNIGSEALSAFIFHQAGKPNPLDLLGAMFVIEGLGLRKADRWASLFAEQLSLPEKALTFFRYHGAADDEHFDKLRAILASGIVTPGLAARIVRTAEVTARLYALQLEEIEHA